MRNARLFVLIGLGVVLAGATPFLFLWGVGWWSMRQLAGDLAQPPATITIQAIAARCHWRYHYGSATGFDVDPGGAPCKPGACKTAFDPNRATLVPVDQVVHVEVITEPQVDPRPFVIPALGVRVGAEAKRVRETWVKTENEGAYFGDLAGCGDGQLALPVAFRAVAPVAFQDWVARHEGGK